MRLTEKLPSQANTLSVAFLGGLDSVAVGRVIFPATKPLILSFLCCIAEWLTKSYTAGMAHLSNNNFTEGSDPRYMYWKTAKTLSLRPTLASH